MSRTNERLLFQTFDNGSEYLSRVKYCVVSTRAASCKLILRGHVWLNQHLAKIFEFLWTSYLLCEQRKLDDVEKLVIKLVSLCKIFLLHFLAHMAMLAIRSWNKSNTVERKEVRRNVHVLGNSSWLTTILCVSIS